MNKTNKVFVSLSAFGIVLASMATIGLMTKGAIETEATTTTVASYSRSGSTNTITGGTFSFTNLAAQTGGYYQDSGTAGTAVCSLQILSTTPLFSVAPVNSIDISATLGGGTTKDSGVGLQAALIDSAGHVVGSAVTITDAITSTNGSVFTTHFATTNYATVYGFKLFHTKISSWNVRYFAASLGANNSVGYLGVETQPTKTIYKTGEILDLSGLVVKKYSNSGANEVTTAFTTSPANGVTIAATTGTTVVVTSTESDVDSTSFFIVLELTPTEAIAAVTAASLPSKTNFPGSYVIDGTVASISSAANRQFVVTDGTKGVYAYGTSSVTVTDLCVGGTVSVLCTLGAYTNSFSTDGLTELSSLTILSNVNPAQAFASWMMDAARDSEVCADKWSSAKTQYSALVADQKTLFLTGSSDSVIVSARARYNAWAAANNETVSAGKFESNRDESALSNAIVVIALCVIVAAGAYLYIRRRKQA